MKILTRYIFKEMLGPTALGFAFYTFIILMKNLFDFAGMIIKRSLPASTVGRLLFLSLPHIIVLTVPMSLLFGILIAVGRLSSDSEIIAMRALGISTRTIYRPVFLFSFLVFLINLYLMNFVLPRGNAEFSALRSEIFTSQIEKELKPRVFYDEYENLTIFVNDIDSKTLQWKGVFVADSRTADETRTATNSAPVTIAQQIQDAHREAAQQPSILPQRSSNKIIVAESGNLSILKPSNQVWMNLKTAQTHLWDPKKPDRYDLNNNVVQRMRLPDKYSDSGGGYQRSLREMSFRELMEQARWSQYSHDPDARETYWAAKVEMNKMFAIPFACIVFGILGLPLGITNRRGGKSSGFSLSIAIILIYYVMINNGEHLADTGKIGPAVAMWTPNLVLLAIGIYLLIRANRDTGARRSDVGIIRRLVQAIKSRKRTGAAVADEEPAILSRFDITFPNTLDRYILREFLKILTLVLVSTAALFIIVDYTDLSGDIRTNHIAFHTVATYYRFLIFQILNYTLPISVLVSTLVTFGIFSKNNEVTAFKSGGMSLYRAALPIVGIAMVISILAYLQLDYVLPYSNQRVEEERNRIKAKRNVHAIATPHQQRLWFLGKGRYIINFLAYDREEKELSQVQVFELHPTKFRLTRRVYADHARWDGIGWVFSNGWIRSFGDDGSSTDTPITRPIRLFYSERPEDFATEARAPEQMTFAQLRRYIETIRNSGYAAEELTVKLYTKTSWPFISLVMALIALPFAFRIGKRGALYGVGIGLILGIFYWMVFAVFTKFGEVGNLPAVLSAWSANILFAIAAIYMFLNVET
ncbi:MAG TPA: LPS export ABC transporter permease LptG [Thermoanaerobaculia bacterium]|jgi:LPS export ABC transporter permease LptG|nr:LPS export ABC transporter permease LptG [Thermoanaerobaculia bacterium]